MQMQDNNGRNDIKYAHSDILEHETFECNPNFNL